MLKSDDVQRGDECCNDAPDAARARTPGLGYLVPFLLAHAGAVAALVQGASRTGVALAATVFTLQGLGITAGDHRSFAHRSFRTSRAFQLVLAILGTIAVQKGELWWVAMHRRHHRYTDGALDPHSPRDGVAWSHVGWFLSPSLGHLRGTRRFATSDDSRNGFVLAPLTFGEGSRNNHHRLPGVARQGLRWWEVDLTYDALRVRAAVHVVWDVVEPERSGS